MAGLTYAALMDQGHRLALQGKQEPWSGPFSTGAAARRALEARLRLLDAIAEHVWAIVGPARRSGASHGTDPLERTPSPSPPNYER